jgi:hypothetical protein
MADQTVQSCLLALLEELEAIGEGHPELYDSEVRQRLSGILLNGFARMTAGYTPPPHYGMFTAEADGRVGAAMLSFLTHARLAAADSGFTTFQARLRAVQDPTIRTDTGRYCDDFFGSANADCFSEDGTLLPPIRHD